jgi:Ca2+-binding RTX toxin-like protein
MTPDWHYTYGGQTMTINDNDGVDTLLMNDVSMADLSFLQEGNNLRIDVNNKEDVILSDYFTSPLSGIETIQTREGNINLSKDKTTATGQIWLYKWGSAAKDLLLGSSNGDWLTGFAGDDTLMGGKGNDTLNGGENNDLLIGGEGNDTLQGGAGNDILYGDTGNDTLQGDAGNDILIGGKGVNTLIGNTGNDTYVFSKGSNNTIVNEAALGVNILGKWFGQEGGNDTVRFGEGITKDDISFLTKGNDLLIQYGDSEFITIKNQKNQGNRIEKLQLDDGSYLSNTDMDKIIQQINAYSKDHGFHVTNNTQIQTNQALMNIVAGGWHS